MSQNRETLEQAGYVLHSRINADEVILTEVDSGQTQLFARNDTFSGWVVVVDGEGYEFVSSVTAADISRLKG